MNTPQSPDEQRLIDLAASIDNVPVRTAPAVADIARRSRNRRLRGGVVAAGFVAIASIGLSQLPDRASPADVDIAASPQVTDGVDSVPVPPATPLGEWVWIDNDQMISRDGTETGYASRRGAVDTGLIIYFENGGMCDTAATCSSARASYTASTFADDFRSDRQYESGLFDEEEPINPFAGWNAIFVPHSTGDLHAGVNPEAFIPGLPGRQALVGGRNVDAMLVDLVAAHPSTDDVIVTGTGAGGMGALLNYERVAAAFPDAQVNLLVDSAVVPLTKDLMPDCLVDSLARGWQRSYPADWDDTIEGVYEQPLAAIYEYLSREYPTAHFGLLSSSGDLKVRTVLGRGTDGCTGTGPLSEAVYEQGLRELETHLTTFANWAVFVVDGTEHGFLTGGNPDIDTAAETTGIRTWLDAFRPDES